MSLPEIIAAAQSGVLSIAFLYLVWSGPQIIRNIAAARKELRQAEAETVERDRKWYAAEREADRAARHAAIDKFSLVIHDEIIERTKDTDKLLTGMAQLREALQSVCKYEPK